MKILGIGTKISVGTVVGIVNTKSSGVLIRILTNNGNAISLTQIEVENLV
jgi:hypothetical protein